MTEPKSQEIEHLADKLLELSDDLVEAYGELSNTRALIDRISHHLNNVQSDLASIALQAEETA